MDDFLYLKTKAVLDWDSNRRSGMPQEPRESMLNHWLNGLVEADLYEQTLVNRVRLSLQDDGYLTVR